MVVGCVVTGGRDIGVKREGKMRYTEWSEGERQASGADALRAVTDRMQAARGVIFAERSGCTDAVG